MTRIQMAELGWQKTRSEFYLKTEQRSDCVGSQVGWLWERHVQVPSEKLVLCCLRLHVSSTGNFTEVQSALSVWLQTVLPEVVRTYTRCRYVNRLTTLFSCVRCRRPRCSDWLYFTRFRHPCRQPLLFGSNPAPLTVCGRPICPGCWALVNGQPAFHRALWSSTDVRHVENILTSRRRLTCHRIRTLYLPVPFIKLIWLSTKSSTHLRLCGLS